MDKNREINELCYSLEYKLTNSFTNRKYCFVTYKEDIKWFTISIKFKHNTEIFIVTKDCCNDSLKLCKREKEILEYLRSKNYYD